MQSSSRQTLPPASPLQEPLCSSSSILLAEVGCWDFGQLAPLPSSAMNRQRWGPPEAQHPQGCQQGPSLRPAVVLGPLASCSKSQSTSHCPEPTQGGAWGGGLQPLPSVLFSFWLLPTPLTGALIGPCSQCPAVPRHHENPPAFPWQRCALGLSHRNGFEELRAAPSVGMGASCCPEPRCWVVNGTIQDEISIFGRRV